MWVFIVLLRFGFCGTRSRQKETARAMFNAQSTRHGARPGPKLAFSVQAGPWGPLGPQPRAPQKIGGQQREVVNAQKMLISYIYIENFPSGCSRLPELHADLLSRHASPLQAYVLWRPKICYVRRDLSLCNGKQQTRRRGGRSVQFPDWVMNKVKGSKLLLLPGSPTPK